MLFGVCVGARVLRARLSDRLEISPQTAAIWRRLISYPRFVVAQTRKCSADGASPVLGVRSVRQRAAPCGSHAHSPGYEGEARECGGRERKTRRDRRNVRGRGARGSGERARWPGQGVELLGLWGPERHWAPAQGRFEARSSSASFATAATSPTCLLLPGREASGFGMDGVLLFYARLRPNACMYTCPRHVCVHETCMSRALTLVHLQHFFGDALHTHTRAHTQTFWGRAEIYRADRCEQPNEPTVTVATSIQLHGESRRQVHRYEAVEVK